VLPVSQPPDPETPDWISGRPPRDGLSRTALQRMIVRPDGRAEGDVGRSAFPGVGFGIDPTVVDAPQANEFEIVKPIRGHPRNPVRARHISLDIYIIGSVDLIIPPELAWPRQRFGRTSDSADTEVSERSH
jgi:hypothetical protein